MGLGLLTTKPFISVFNLDEDQLADADLKTELAASVAPADGSGGSQLVPEEASYLSLPRRSPLDLLSLACDAVVAGAKRTVLSATSTPRCSESARQGKRSHPITFSRPIGTGSASPLNRLSHGGAR